MNLKKLLCTLIVLLCMPITFAQEVMPKVFYDYNTSSYGLKDSNGDNVIEAKYESIKTFYDDYAIVTQNGFYGVINKNGEEIVSPSYQYIGRYSNGTFVAKQDNKLGAIDTKGKVIVPFEYDKLSSFRKNGALALKNNKIGLIRKNNAVISDFIWDNASLSSSDLDLETFVFVIDGKYGVANFDGKILVRQSSDLLKPFSNDQVVFIENNLRGTKKFDNTVILEAKYSKIFETNTGFIVLKDKMYTFLDESGEAISNNYSGLKKINNNLFSYYNESTSGLYNLDQKREVLPSIYSDISSLKDVSGIDSKYILVKIHDNGLSKSGIANKNGNLLLSPINANIKFITENIITYYDDNSNFGIFNVITRKDSGLVYSNLSVDKTGKFITASNKSGKYALLNADGETIIEPSQDAILEKDDIFLVVKDNRFAIYSKEHNKLSSYNYNFFHGFKALNDDFVSIVRSGDKYGIIKSDGSYLAHTVYDYISEFKYGYSVFRKNNKTGLIDQNGDIVINPIYDQLYLVSDQLAIFKLNDKLGYIKTNGRVTIDAKFDSATAFNKFGLATISIDGEKSLIRSNGNIAMKTIYSEIVQISDDLAVVKDKISNTYGILSLSGDIIADVVFDEIGDFANNNITYIKVSSKYALVNKKGKIITEFKYDSIGDFENGLAKATLDGNSGLVNADGTFFKQ